MVKTLSQYIKQFKLATILTPVFTGLEVVMEILIPFVTASIIDKGINAGDMQQVCFYGAIMLVLAFLSLAFGILAGKFAAEASTGFACNLREAIFSKVQTFSFKNIDRYSTAGLITRMTTDVTNIQNAFQMVLRIAVRAPLMFICSLAMCIFINAKISIIFLVAIVVLVVAMALIIVLTMPVFMKLFKKYDALNASTQENVSAIRVVKAFVREKFEVKKFAKANDELYKIGVKAEGNLAFVSPLMMLVIYGCIIALSWFGAQYIVVGELTTGNLTSLFSYVMSMLMSLMMLSMIFVMITMSQASAKRIAEVLNDTPDITNPENPIMQVENGDIDFENVSFRYGDDDAPFVLEDINLSIPAGQTVGIIGQTGSGKSSLVNLISRLYDTSVGSVKVAGRDVKEYDLDVLRSAVSVVLQKNVLFSGTIIENLRWGNENATVAECKEACALACADEFIDTLPDSYETHIEQGGTNVSGGQKQRLCIARALLKNPKVLILDDSTSAVDTATDAKIREAFNKRIPGTTKIIISQRISSVSSADKIIVLNNGKIENFDTHENLLKNSELYKEIYIEQTSASGDFDEKMN